MSTQHIGVNRRRARGHVVAALSIAGAAFAAACGGGDAAAPTSPIASASATPTAPCAVSPGGADPVPAAASWNWEPVNIPNLQVESVFIDPEDEHVLFAGGTFGLYTTQDGGASWRVPVTGFVNANAVAFLPASSCTAFAGGSQVLYRSDDRGRIWRAVHTFPDGIRSIHVAHDSRHLYVGPQVNPQTSQSPDGIWVSPDLGATWSLATLPTESRGLIPWDIEEDASGVLYTGTEIYNHPQPYHPQYYRSSDGGASWQVAGTLPWHVSKTQADPTRTLVYALTEGAGLYVTEDQGNRWTRRGGVSYILELLIDPRSPQTLYAGDHTAGGRAGGAYVSTDEGRTFHAIGMQGRITGSFAFNGAGTRLYAAAYQSGLFRAIIPATR
jgi:photosystem II stability/assembly factor-like uncharacterized protein